MKTSNRVSGTENNAAKDRTQTKNWKLNVKVLLPLPVVDWLDQATHHNIEEREKFIKEAIREKLNGSLVSLFRLLSPCGQLDRKDSNR